MKLGCIGDDFTGSSDLGLILSDGGLRTTLYSGVPDQLADADVDCGIVALKSRSIPVDQAIAQSLSAYRWLIAQGVQQVVFKYCSTFDSTPQGNIGPVIEALIAESGTKAPVVVCPAFPAAGRSVYQGHLFVQDKLLNESGMQDHPLTPMTDPDLRRWLAQQVKVPVGWVPRAVMAGGQGAAHMVAEVAAGRQILICDAVDDSDLLTLGALVKDAPIVTGASGIGLGLPANFGAVPGQGADFVGVKGPVIGLSGSCSATTRRQIAAHQDAGLPLLKVEADALAAGQITPQTAVEWALEQGSVPVIYSSADPAEVRAAQDAFGADKAADMFEIFFADTARIARDGGITRIIAAGGETSGAVVGALDLTALTIGPKIATGVPALTAAGLALALKSGNFGTDDFFTKAAQVLEG